MKIFGFFIEKCYICSVKVNEYGNYNANRNLRIRKDQTLQYEIQ